MEHAERYDAHKSFRYPRRDKNDTSPKWLRLHLLAQCFTSLLNSGLSELCVYFTVWVKLHWQPESKIFKAKNIWYVPIKERNTKRVPVSILGLFVLA